jgi:hypothetical protein
VCSSDLKELQGLGLRVDLLDQSEDALIDAEHVIATSTSSTATVPADDSKESILDEADDIGEIDGNSGMSIQDIDEIDVNESEEA